MHTSSVLPRLTANIFGVLGYAGVILEWIWLAAIFLPLLLHSEAIKWTIPEKTAHETMQYPGLSLPPTWLFAISAVVTIAMIALTIYIILKVPSSALKTTSKAAHHTADQLVPVVTHHKKISKKKERLISARIFFYLKLVATSLPVLLCFFVLLTPKLDISFSLILLVTATASLLALVGFGLQVALAKLLNVPFDRLV